MSAVAVKMSSNVVLPDPGISYEIDNKHNLLVARVTGEISFQQMHRYLNRLIKDTKFQCGLNSYYDLTECITIAGNLSDLCAFTQSLSFNNNTEHNAKTALLLDANNHTLIKLVQGIVLMTSESCIEHQYFLDTQIIQACQFIAQDPQTVAQLLTHT